MNTKFYRNMMVLGLIALFFITGGAWAGMKSIEGSIQGANCVVHGDPCPTDASDAHIALERDFVLFAGKGKYYFLPNVDRAFKTKYLGQNMRIKGDLKGYKLLASEVAVKKGGTFRTVWSWKEIVNDLKGRGSN